MEFVRLLTDRKAARADECGGKGANLALLTHRGFPVPAGLVVTARAYSAFVSRLPDLADRIARLDPSNDRGLSERCRNLRDALANVPVPDDVSRAITDLMKALPAGRFSVRSSSTLEDLDSAAFAGQHDTFLNVPAPDVVGRVRDCYLSLWEERAVLYRLRRGFRIDAATMAVVVQTMVASAVSGVLFTIDPVSGSTAEMVVDANQGLGESVVAGEVSVDHFRIARSSLEVLETRIGAKEFQVVASDSGVIHTAVSDPGRASIGPEALRQLCRKALEVEASYQFPQDVEWALDAQGSIQLLQSRPITTIPERWTRDESAERFPNAMTPLGWEFIEYGFHESLRYSLKMLGLPAFPGRWFARFDGYVYGNQNAVDIFLKSRALPFGSLDDLRAMLARITQEYGWVLELPARWTRDLDRYLLGLGPLNEEVKCDHTAAGWFDLVLRIDTLGRGYFRPNIAISITHGLLHKVLFAFLSLLHSPLEAKRLYDRLTRFCETKTSLINKEIYELYRLAAADQELAHLLVTGDRRRLIEDGALAPYQEFRERFERFIADHAHREVDPDPYQPFWGDAPWVPLDSIGLLLQHADVEDPFERELAAKGDQQAAEEAFLRQVPAELHFFAAELLRLARAYSSLDDVEHYQSTRLNRVFRHALLGLGRRLLTDGVVDRADSLFFSTRKVLEAFIAHPGSAQTAALTQTIAGNRADYERQRLVPPKWTLVQEVEPARPEGALQGIAGAPGVVEGPAFLVCGVEDFSRFPAGSVLVARTTNPSWTPLFYNAVGIIAESGGPLSHGAVTAREMGLPAVMGVKGCMTHLKSGQRVRVDGSHGVVALLQKP